KAGIYQLNNLFLTGDHLVLTNLGWVSVETLNPKVHLIATIRTRLEYLPILLLEKTDRVEDVYDFTVEEDHSFCAEDIVLHNCFGSNISDSMESILFTQAEVGMMT